MDRSYSPSERKSGFFMKRLNCQGNHMVKKKKKQEELETDGYEVCYVFPLFISVR